MKIIRRGDLDFDPEMVIAPGRHFYVVDPATDFRYVRPALELVEWMIAWVLEDPSVERVDRLLEAL